MPFPVKVRINVRIKINVKGVGQECPTHTGKVKVGSEINVKGLPACQNVYRRKTKTYLTASRD